MRLIAPSNESSEMPVLFGSDRIFRLWRYGVGHSQLLLRAVPDETDDSCLDILFEGVVALKMPARYRSLKVTLADVGESYEIVQLAGISDLLAEKSLALAVRSPDTTGLVLCRAATALHGGSELLGDPDGSVEQAVVWRSA
jgi:hypothetical protein